MYTPPLSYIVKVKKLAPVTETKQVLMLNNTLTVSQLYIQPTYYKNAGILPVLGPGYYRNTYIKHKYRLLTQTKFELVTSGRQVYKLTLV